MIFTAGHSTMDACKFASMLKGQVDLAIDVRSHPGSAKWPHFDREQMQHWLPEAGIEYQWWPSLGGWNSSHLYLADEMRAHGVDVEVYARGKFPKQRIGTNFPVPTQQLELRPVWYNVGLYDYAAFTSLPEFLNGLKSLMELGANRNVAVFCCETLWWKCHRSMIADCLVFAGSDAYHIQPKLIKHSAVIGNRLKRYESWIVGKWQHLIGCKHLGNSIQIA